MSVRSAASAGVALALGFFAMAEGRVDAAQAGPRARLAGALFADLDVNGDGVLTEAEVESPARSAFRKLQARADVDGDGTIDPKEFEALAARVAEARVPAAAKAGTQEPAKPAAAPKPAGPQGAKVNPQDASPAERAKALLARFRAMDADKDGRVSREEFKGRPAAFDRLDVDRDGYLDKTDLKSIRDRRQDGPAAKGDPAKGPGSPG